MDKITQHKVLFLIISLLISLPFIVQLPIFGVVIFSRFVSTIDLGALSSLIVIFAVIGDILILPSVALLLSVIGIKFYNYKEIKNEN